MVVEQEMDEKWEVTESLILSDALITVSFNIFLIGRVKLG
jgi:hypothetical protein